MPLTTRRESITAHDGGRFDGHLVLPEAGSGPGLLLLQEIFGVGSYIEAAAERLAGLGYVVLAPDLFWRIEPNMTCDHDDAGLAEAMSNVQRFDFVQGLQDCDAALAHLRSLPEVGGRGAGVMGFCLGGRLTYSVAARSDPDTAVSYYGSGIADALGEADDITCPLLFHFGGKDPYLPMDQVERIRGALGGRANVEIHVQEDAGHAFDNHEAPMFHDPEAAAAAWEITVAFLARTLPVDGGDGRQEARVGHRADELLPEETTVGSADPQAQARQILAESDERSEDRNAAPGKFVEHRRSEETVDPT
jgi:carboxymethylenebutenolidase